MKHAPLTIMDIYDMESPYVTEYRRLLYRILNHEKQPDLKSIMLTSAMTAEGKSTACSLLAMTAAVKKRLKTLIIDADLRLPSIHRLFGLSPEPGLSEVLSEGYNPRDAVRKTDIENLHILTAGRQRENPTAVFDAEAIGQLIDEMKFYYDFILVDCAPLLPVSDPMLLAARVDGVLLVVKAGSTQQELVQRAVQIVDPGRNNVLGVVLNNMNESLPFYYDYSYYHYDYGQGQKPKINEPGETKKKSKERGLTAEKKGNPARDNVSPG